MYVTVYPTRIVGDLVLASDGTALTGCWFDNDRYFGYGASGALERADGLGVFDQAADWLDRYFAGERPSPFELPLAARATQFQMNVRRAMLRVPYGQLTTYGEIADDIARETGRRASARAVGGAVGHNPLCVIVPCHRVVGAGGNLTGFGGGLDYKVALLRHEGVDMGGLYRPKRGTALEGKHGAAAAFSARASNGARPSDPVESGTTLRESR